MVSFAADAEIQFNKDIRPILSDNCFHCHGPDKDDRKANLRLDTAEGLLTDLGGHFAVVPGNPEKSEVYKRITHKNPEERMPPKSMHKVLSEQEISTIYAWIKQGAQWQNHWSFEPIADVPIPPIKQRDWAKTPIDSFILSRLEQEQLSASAQADKRTLIRRLALDLTGLPPSQQLIQQFVNDDSANAYEKVVDKLLALPAYGEHQAHYWLDAARYADTHGLHLDNLRSIWPYRDWVVNAFNQNMPFDQFSIEQLAGDLLPNPTQEQLVATGFVRSNPSTNEGGAIEEEYAAIYAKDRTETLSTVWLGLTTGCAGCHDHKFDPISQKEFYQLTAFFRNTTEKPMDGNAMDYPPSIHVLSAQDKLLKESLAVKDKTLKSKLKAIATENKSELSSWIKQLDGQQPVPIENSHLVFHLPADEGANNQLTTYVDDKKSSAKVSGKYQWVNGKQGKALAINQSTLIELGNTAEFNYRDRFSVSFWLKVPKEKIKSQAIIGRIDVDPNKGWWSGESTTSGWFVELSNENSLKLALNYGESSFIEGSLWNVIKADTWQHFTIQYNGTASQKSFQYYVDGEEIQDAQARSLSTEEFNKVANTKISNPLAVGFVQNPYAHKENRLDKEVMAKQQASPFVAVQDLRVYNMILTENENHLIAKMPEIKSALATNTNDLSEAQKDLLADYYASQISVAGKALTAQRISHLPQIADIEKHSPITLVLQEKANSSPSAHVLNRGLYDDKGEEVFSSTLAVLPSIDKSENLNRLDLAKWLVRDDHPLTARVTVNRFWQYLFGKGLVETAGDFGSQGTPPTHPELLDWLANDFKNNGWDVKRVIKQMVMSATYQQSSKITSELKEKDPLNQLYARSSRYRLDAEVIRDQALHVSGLLIDKVGGKPVKPYQPDGLWKTVAYVDSNTAKFVQDYGENLYRKSLYTFRKRTASPPGMALFDAPDRESCVVQRDQTNTPLQALLLMNDPQFIEAARVMAESVLKANTEDKFSYLIEHSLGRKPDEFMLKTLKNSYQNLKRLYLTSETAADELINIGESQADEQLDPIELASWTMLANQVFNLDEFITKN